MPVCSREDPREYVHVIFGLIQTLALRGNDLRLRRRSVVLVYKEYHDQSLQVFINTYTLIYCTAQTCNGIIHEIETFEILIIVTEWNKTKYENCSPYTKDH